MLVAYFLTVCLFSCLANAQDLFYFSKQPDDTFVKSGASVKLECQVSHQENIMYYWNMNDTRLPNTTRKRQIGSSLYISRVDRFQDTGVYSCIAENTTSGYSITSRPAKVEVICGSSLYEFIKTTIERGQTFALLGEVTIRGANGLSKDRDSRISFVTIIYIMNSIVLGHRYGRPDMFHISYLSLRMSDTGSTGDDHLVNHHVITININDYFMSFVWCGHEF
ncbi:hypothetical protein RUM43_009217 [Polyplax serrata]|uniref:Ig-like domain-containing protein n=1 Tax=Polyplax serrata TaxID=468196 RepID=A0AAN8NP50_POLSC